MDKTVKVIERVDNVNGTGKAVLSGQEWTARTKEDEMGLEEGELARVVGVEGVKLILIPLRQQEE